MTLHASVRAIGIDLKGKMAYGSGGLLLPDDKLVIATGSTQSNLYRQIRREVSRSGYAELQSAVREVRHPWFGRSTGYS